MKRALGLALVLALGGCGGSAEPDRTRETVTQPSEGPETPALVEARSNT